MLYSDQEKEILRNIIAEAERKKSYYEESAVNRKQNKDKFIMAAGWQQEKIVLIKKVMRFI